MEDNSKRVTVRLDRSTYIAMKQLGLDTDTSNQDIIYAALREYLARLEAAS